MHTTTWPRCCPALRHMSMPAAHLSIHGVQALHRIPYHQQAPGQGAQVIAAPDVWPASVIVHCACGRQGGSEKRWAKDFGWSSWRHASLGGSAAASPGFHGSSIHFPFQTASMGSPGVRGLQRCSTECMVGSGSCFAASSTPSHVHGARVPPNSARVNCQARPSMGSSTPPRFPCGWVLHMYSENAWAGRGGEGRHGREVDVGWRSLLGILRESLSTLNISRRCPSRTLHTAPF